LTVDEINNFILSAQIFLQAPLPQGDGIGIISTSGGSAGLAADLVEKKGLRLGELSHKSLEELSGIIRWFSTAKNPFDFAGQVLRDETFARKVYDIFLRDPDIGLLILVMTPMQFFDKPLISQAIKAGKDNQKPVIILYEGGKLDPDTEGIIKNSNTPFFTSPRECIEVIGNLIRYSQFIERDKSILETINIPAGAKEKVLSVINKSGGQMVEREAKEVISHYGIPITEQKLATSLEEALAAAASIGYPVALKVESTNVLHKSDVGGVELNINNDEELKKAYEGMLKRVQMTLPNVKIRGVLIQEMVRDKGVEVIVGVTRDPQFGPTLMFGLGGVFVEALEDISFRICPINLMDAKEMVREIKGYKLLEGFRGSPQADIKVLEEVLVKFSKLAMEFEPAIKEIEINPLLVLPVGRGVKALDARVALC
jgi:acetyltransferase